MLQWWKYSGFIYSVNEDIMDIVRFINTNYRYVQRTGQGVDIIFKDMVSMGKPYPRYRSFNDAVSLTIFSAIDNTEFVKFITEVQDKNSKISLWLK